MGATSTSIITITVNAAISFGSPDTYVTTFGVTRTFSGLVASNGTGTLTYSISPNTSGISIDTNTGVISVLGTLSANNYYETVTATDSLSVSTKIAITILVNPAMTFGTLPTFGTTEGTSKTFSALSVNGGTGAKVFGLITDRPEITIDSGTGAITISDALGHGTYTESITVTDSVNATKQILATFTVNNLMAITSGGSDVTTTRGRADSSTAIIVSGGTGSKTYALGLTAAGISIDSTTGVVRVASTTAAGTWYETVTITDSVGSSIVKNLTVIVNPEISVSGGNNIKTTNNILVII